MMITKLRLAQCASTRCSIRRQSLRVFPWLAGLAFLSVGASISSAAFTITNGNAVFEYPGANSNPFSNSSLNSYNFRPEGGTTTDHVFYYNWGYRVPLGSNTGLTHLVAPAISFPDPQTVVIETLNNGPGPVGQNRFDARVTIRVTDGATPGAARLDSALQLTALTSNAAPVQFQLFHVVDVDFNGTPGNDGFSITNPTGVDGMVADTILTSPATLGTYQGLGASAFQLGGSSAMRGIINGASNANLNNTAAFSGDGAYGFQWTVTLAPGASTTVTSNLVIVPEPMGLAMVLAGIVALVRRRR